MKIIKVNDNQIRCVLSREDLESRNIKLSELAYGNQKARSLFSEMMTKANEEYGFDVSDDPVMVEAIPVSSGDLIIVVTKVSSPEELDTRFARFSNYQKGLHKSDSEADSLLSGKRKTSASDILDLYRKMTTRTKASSEASGSASESSGEAAAETPSETKESNADHSMSRLYLFKSLDDLIGLSHVIGKYFDGSSSVLRLNDKKDYVLHISQDLEEDPEQFNKICNIISEFGSQISPDERRLGALREHSHVLLKKNAIRRLQKL